MIAEQDTSVKSPHQMQKCCCVSVLKAREAVASPEAAEGDGE
jgi:hypothetical protein